MKKKIRYLVFGLLTGLTALYLLSAWFDHRFQNDDQYKTQWILNKKNNQYDYVVLGASHSYVGFEVDLANKMTGFKGINISLDGSLIGTQSVLADVFFNRNKNTCNYLFFCLDNPEGLNSELLADIADGRMMPYLNYPEVFDFYKAYGKKWYFDRYVPFWKYAEYNYYWGPHAFANTWHPFMNHDYDAATGSRYDSISAFNDSDAVVLVVDYQQDNAKYKYFRKIIQECRDHNIKPILFTLPFGLADSSERSRENIAKFKAYCRKQDLDFIYLGDYLNYQFEYFTTRGHLNKKGAELTTKKLMEIMLKENLIQAKRSSTDSDLAGTGTKKADQE